VGWIRCRGPAFSFINQQYLVLASLHGTMPATHLWLRIVVLIFVFLAGQSAVMQTPSERPSSRPMEYGSGC